MNVRPEGAQSFIPGIISRTCAAYRSVMGDLGAERKEKTSVVGEVN